MMKFIIVSTFGNSGYNHFRVHRAYCKDVIKEVRKSHGTWWEVEAYSVEEVVKQSLEEFADQDQDFREEHYDIINCAKGVV